MTVLKIKKLREDARLPEYAHPGDAGLDLFSVEKVSLAPGERKIIPTGVAMEIPKGRVGFIWDKSGIAVNSGLKTMAGVVDSGYRGEILVCLVNLSRKKFVFQKNEKVAQMVIQKKETISVKEVLALSETSRGEGRFGSTGK